ncbi:MAG: 50S ribosomal protein L9 [Pseudomonadota bacterium]|nr:50S ribosomal protein L9 [Pseudomonadota bacterium]MEC8847421.1 50S ribosomal protein L9 [Pseudomonadota bacterium]
MDVILLERVEKLGQMGDVVSVKPGYARNYLLPRRKALRATKHNLEFFEGRRSQLEADNLQRKSEAESVAKKVDGLTVPVIRAAGESGQLYGSVTARDIAEAIIAAGVTVTRQQVMLDRALKTLGLEMIKVVLHPEVSASVVVNIARSQDEAEQQAHLGRAVGVDELDQDDDDDDGDDLDALLATVDSDGPAEAAPAPEGAAEESAADNTEASEDDNAG